MRPTVLNKFDTPGIDTVFCILDSANFCDTKRYIHYGLSFEFVEKEIR